MSVVDAAPVMLPDVTVPPVMAPPPVVPAPSAVAPPAVETPGAAVVDPVVAPPVVVAPATGVVAPTPVVEVVEVVEDVLPIELVASVAPEMRCTLAGPYGVAPGICTLAELAVTTGACRAAAGCAARVGFTLMIMSANSAGVVSRPNASIGN